ncbi:MAG TPA: hypothetical protein PK808_02170 [Polymorphobacter sp.]|jgi:predicted transglutaminase-like cysteine proteinase|nr:hypothetical protein [Polymorphobacter sp.]
MRAPILLLPLGLALATLGACSHGDAPQAWTSAALAPMPPGALAFCAAHGGDCPQIPAASAMPEGGAVNAPRGWHGFCQRHPETDGCRG